MDDTAPTNPPVVPAAWGAPWWRQRQLDPTGPAFVPGGGSGNETHRNWTLLGTLGRSERAVVDPRGLVTPWEGAWSLDWWVGAEDRWYLPAREATVRQRSVDHAPVVETVMRVHGGDVVHRAFAAAGPDSEPWLIVEVENRTAAAVAIALAVRPWGPTGAARVGSVAMDGPWVMVDDVPGVVLPQAPWRWYAAGAGDPGVLASVLGGAEGDGAGAEGPLVCPDGRAELAAVVPLPHTLVVRVGVPMAAPAAHRRSRAVAPPALPAQVPSAEQVASGWRAQTTRGMRLEVPDASLATMVEVARRHLLAVAGGEDLLTWPQAELSYPDTAVVLEALGVLGFADEVANVLSAWEDRQALDGRFLGNDRRRDAAGAALVALANHWRATGDDELVDALVGPVAKAAHWIDRRATSRRHRRDPATLGLLPDGDVPGVLGAPGVSYHDAWWSLRGLEDAAAMLRGVDQPDAAGEVDAAAQRLRSAIATYLAGDERRLGTAVVPVGPGRPLDGGVVGLLDAVLLGVVDPLGPQATDTLEWIRARSVVDDALFDDVGATGLLPGLTARLARVELARGEPAALARLRWLAGAATGAGTWPSVIHPRTGGGARGAGCDPVVAADAVLGVRDLMAVVSGGVVNLAPVVPEAWLGRSWEVHDLPTAAGRLGFAVRWHGERPALLWELEGAEPGVVVRAGGLDASFSSTDPVGEVLLGPVGGTGAAVAGGDPDGGFQ